MTTTLDLNRLKNVIKAEDIINKYIISDKGEIKFVEDNDLVYVFSSSNVVSKFCLAGTSNKNELLYESGKVVSPEINGKQYILDISGNSINYLKTINDNGLVDMVRKIPYEQPSLTNNSSDYFNVTASSNNSNAYKAFDGYDNTYWVSESGFSQSLTMTLYKPIIVEKFAIKNSSDTQSIMTSFKIYGQDKNNNWLEIITVDGSSAIVPDKSANAWNEYISSDMSTEFKAFKLEILSSLNDSTVSISRFNIIGKYQGAFLPNSRYNLFIIGKEDIHNSEAKLISTINDVPTLPDGYTYGVKIGNYETNYDTITEMYPKQDIVNYFNKNKVVMKVDNEKYTFTVYDDGLKIMVYSYEKINEFYPNIVFPVSYDDIPNVINLVGNFVYDVSKSYIKYSFSSAAAGNTQDKFIVIGY